MKNERTVGGILLRCGLPVRLHGQSASGGPWPAHGSTGRLETRLAG